MSFKHKYITNPSVTTGDAIVNAAQKLTISLRGIIPPPLVKSGIDHLRALTNIFNATKEGYNDQEETKYTKTTAHSPRVPMGSPPPRVIKDKNLPDLVPTDTSNNNNEGDTQNKEISLYPSAQHKFPKHHFKDHGQSYAILLPNVPHVIPN